MTEKLKCPICGAELEQCFENMSDLACSNIECDCATIPLPPKIWQALIVGKKAQDALTYAIGVLDNLTEIGGVDMEIIKIKKMAGIK